MKKVIEWVGALGVIAVLLGLLALAAYSSTAATAAQPSTNTASNYVSVVPDRVLNPTSAGPGVTITLDLSTKVPTNATSVILNVTGTSPTAGTYVTVFPFGVARPPTSNLNLVAGQTAPNLVSVQLGTGRKVSLYNNTGSVTLIADLQGYFLPSAPPYFVSGPVVNVPPLTGPGDYMTTDVLCQPGDKATGGGFFANDGGDDEGSVVVSTSAPVNADLVGWKVQAYNPGAIAGSLQGYVTCVDMTP